MNREAHTLRSLPLEAFDHPEPGDAWEGCPLAAFSDARLLEAAVAAITPPKVAAPSSFVLHAPLELLARAALLPRVAPVARGDARRRIAAVAVRYAHAGPEVEPPIGSFKDDATALAALIDSLRSGDPQGADTAISFLLPRVPLWRLRAALVDEVVPSLGAAAHAPILLAALPRVADRIVGVDGLLRAPLRTIAAAAGVRITWHQEPNDMPIPHDPQAVLLHALIAPPHRESSSWIAPTMLAVQRSGDAAQLLAGPARALLPQQAERVLLRVAALAMLQDDPTEAPYGWSHCLTLPQAVLANADAAGDAHALVAVAATQVLGMRATLGKVALDPSVMPAMPAAQADLITTLATRAALHPDAHLAKYTLACFDACARDPGAAGLFLAAAGFLGAWWDRHDNDSSDRPPG